MSFPNMLFGKANENNSVQSDLIGAANGAVVAVGGISLAAIAACALKALGMSFAIKVTVVAFPVSLAIFGALTAVGFGLSAGVRKLDKLAE